MLYVAHQGFDNLQYDVVLNYPRRLVAELDQSASLKDAGLFPRETVFIQEKSTDL